jgi:hypothetical protein
MKPGRKYRNVELPQMPRTASFKPLSKEEDSFSG